MKKILKKVFVASGALLVSSAVFAQETILEFGFDAGSTVPTTLSPDISPVTAWTPGTVTDNKLKVTTTGSSIVTSSFSFTVGSGKVLDLTGISFLTGKEKGENPGLGTITFGLDLNGGDWAVSGRKAQTGTFGFTGDPALAAGLTGVNTLTFSLDSSQAGSLFTLDNFKLMGNISAVPEPSTVFGLAAAGFASVYFARRKKKAVVQGC